VRRESISKRALREKKDLRKEVRSLKRINLRGRSWRGRVGIPGGKSKRWGSYNVKQGGLPRPEGGEGRGETGTLEKSTHLLN